MKFKDLFENEDVELRPGASHGKGEVGPFSSPKKKEHYEVFRSGVHIGTIENYTGSETKKVNGRNYSTGKTPVRWSHRPVNSDGSFSKAFHDYRSKKHAIEGLMLVKKI